MKKTARRSNGFISTGERKAQDNVRILLKSDDGPTDSTISEQVSCLPMTVHNTRKDYTKRGLAVIHRRKPDREYEHKLEGNAEAHLIKIACSEPPEGHSRKTLHPLADELVTLDEIDFESISHESVRQRLKKNALKPHFSSYWEMSPEQDANFVYYMRDVFDISYEPYDGKCPVICFDETNKTLRGHERDPPPDKLGAVARIDPGTNEMENCDFTLYRAANTLWFLPVLPTRASARRTLIDSSSTTPQARKLAEGR